MKTNSKTAQWLRFVAVAPLFVASLFLFSGSSYKAAENSSLQEEPQQVTTMVNDDAPKSSSDYDALYKEYLQIIEDNRAKKNAVILNRLPENDMLRMKEIFLSMTPEQQSTLPFIFQRYPAPIYRVPTTEEFESWKNPSEYGVWMDEKRIDNSELNKYQASDFSNYGRSRLTRTAKNYGKHVYQLHIMTNSYYQEQKAKIDADKTLYLWPNNAITKK